MKHPRLQRNGNLHLWCLKAQKVYCSLRGCIRKNWNDTEKGFFLLTNYAIVFAALFAVRAHMTLLTLTRVPQLICFPSSPMPAWPLHKDDTLFQSGRPTGLNIYFTLRFYMSFIGSFDSCLGGGTAKKMESSASASHFCCFIGFRWFRSHLIWH